MSRARPLLTTVLALVLLATTAAGTFIVVGSGLLWAGTGEEPSPAVQAPEASVEDPVSPVGVVESLQLSQPRDPFRPLVTEDSPFAGLPGVGGEPGTPGDDGFAPTGTTITLQQIRDVAGTLRATVTVNGVSYDVGVGDTFAGSYKVVSLSETKGVFMFGDSAFELSVGQQILK